MHLNLNYENFIQLYAMLKIDQFTAGQYLKQIEYKAFLPCRINDTWSWSDIELTKLIEK